MSTQKMNTTKKRKKKINKRKSSFENLLKSLLGLFVTVALIFAAIIYVDFPNLFDTLKNSLEKMEQQLPQSEVSNSEQPTEEETSNNINLPEVDLSEFIKYNFSYTDTINISGNISSLDYKIYIPQDIYGKQYIKINSVSVEPQNILKEGLDKVFIYKWSPVLAKTLSVIVQGEAAMRTYDLQTAKRLNYNISPEKDLSKYLKSENMIESDDPYIINVANNISGNTKEEFLQNVYEFLQRNIEYTIVPNLGAKATLQQHRGKCTDYAAAMVALCRARNIPARIVSGDVFENTVGAHAWVEVYFDEYGWVMYDPTFQGVTVQRIVNGKSHVSTTLDSTSLPFEYLLTAHNILKKQNLNYYRKPNQQGAASSSTSFSYGKIQ